MLGLNRNEEVTFELCGTLIAEKNIVRPEKISSTENLYCSTFPNISTRSQAVLKIHVAKKHNVKEWKKVHKCHAIDKDFLNYYPLRLKRRFMGQTVDQKQKALTLGNFSEM